MSPKSLSDKLMYAATGAVTFLVASYPYNDTFANCSSEMKFMKTGLFFLLSYLSMKFFYSSMLTDGLMLKYSYYSALIFFMLTSSEAYDVTNKYLGGDLVGGNSCPSVKGLVIHAVVYLVLLTLVMYFPSDPCTN